MLDLNCLLLRITLINTDLIHPEKFAAEIVGTNNRKSIVKSWCNGDFQSVAYHTRCFFRRSPDVGQSIELDRLVFSSAFCSQTDAIKDRMKYVGRIKETFNNIFWTCGGPSR